MYRNDVTYYIRIEQDTSRLSWGIAQQAALLTARKSAGFTRRRLAELAETTEPLIQKLETGASKAIDSGLMLSICAALGVEPTTFKYKVLPIPNDFAEKA
jgi:transcriptional regulator with XRE-family HTH domain